jgi:peptidase M42 family hydrolase
LDTAGDGKDDPGSFHDRSRWHMPEPKLLPVDMEYVRRVLVDLLRIPSPTGRTDDAVAFVCNELDALGVATSLTRRGALHGVIGGDAPARAVIVHADTTGCIVKGVKNNGRLHVVAVGRFSARFAEGARVTILTDDDCYTGTILPVKASGHAYGDAVDVARIGWEDVEVRVDERVESAEGVRSLGIAVGDFVALDSNPAVTASGFVNARHLDDKAGVAAVLGAVKALRDHGGAPHAAAQLLVTTSEEVGQGASHGLQAGVAEIVGVDNAVAAAGQESREDAVTVAMGDRIGPFDYHLSRHLLRLCDELGIPVRRDVYNHYRSDVDAAIDAGVDARGALIGPGVDASHGHERTHLDGVRHTAELIAAYLQRPLISEG